MCLEVLLQLISIDYLGVAALLRASFIEEPGATPVLPVGRPLRTVFLIPMEISSPREPRGSVV